MNNADLMCLDNKYSTTRLLTPEKPIIENGKDDKFQSVLFLRKGSDRKGEGGLRTQGYFKKSLEDKPLITIVTVVFNGEKHLEETILSVINQSYDNVEYIIIDGGSTDSTLDVIKKYNGQIDYWVSESDGGIYEAMNKGIKLSIGSVIGIINSDDFYMVGAALDSMSAIVSTGADFSYGKVHLIKENGVVYGSTRPLSQEEIKTRIFKEMPYPHPSIFVTKSAYKKSGIFDLHYKLSADYEFLLRIFTQKYIGVNTEKFVSFFREGGRSGGIQTFNETRKVVMRYGVHAATANSMFAWSLIKVFFHKLTPKLIAKYIRQINHSKHF